MPREVMRRSAADNPYLHKDFHGALSAGLQYLEDRFGAEAVREYLWQFTLTYYAPLRARIRTEGLSALRDYFAQLYRIEGGEVQFTLSDDELIVRVAACPAVTHMRERGYPVARLWVETTRTVNEALVADTPFGAELLEYDDTTGRSVQRFYRRSET